MPITYASFYSQYAVPGGEGIHVTQNAGMLNGEIICVENEDLFTSHRLLLWITHCKMDRFLAKANTTIDSPPVLVVTAGVAATALAVQLLTKANPIGRCSTFFSQLWAHVCTHDMFAYTESL
jgi:hypothetical protein